MGWSRDLANFFWKEPDSKYFKLSGMVSDTANYSTLSLWCVSSH